MEKNATLECIHFFEQQIFGCKTKYVRRSAKYSGELIHCEKQTLRDISLNHAILDRESTRKVLKENQYTLQYLFELIQMSMGVRKIKEQSMFYMTPVAGGIRELRYFFFVKRVQGMSPGVWENIPETNELKKINTLSSDLNLPFYENWEWNAPVNLVFCFNVLGSLRSYKNNILHCAFEAGCIIQLIQMYLSATNKKSCISGYINRDGFNKVISSNDLFPIYALSIF